MNIKKTKDFVSSLVGKPCLFKVNVGRNKWEKFEGVIISVYDKVFTVIVGSVTKSFSYNDVLIRDVQIKENNL